MPQTSMPVSTLQKKYNQESAVISEIPDACITRVNTRSYTNSRGHDPAAFRTTCQIWIGGGQYWIGASTLGHASIKTTQRHYLRRGKIVGSTKGIGERLNRGRLSLTY
jgi:hypothetical protein